jgi:microcystin-dependent protein
MADPFIAEIRIFAGNFPPRGWAFCNGQLLPISQNTALFALVGTFYGGDGKVSFGLPNLQGRAPVHTSDSGDYFLGATGGEETVTLTQAEIAQHTHAFNVSAEVANQTLPAANRMFAQSQGGNAYQSNTTQSLVPLNPGAVTITGASLPHNNMQPYLALTFIIALQGIFPPRG